MTEEKKRTKIRGFAGRVLSKRSQKVFLWSLGAALLIGILSAFAMNALLGRIIHMRQEVAIPDIEGMQLSQALDVLAENNLSLMKVAEKYDESIPAGSIISQSPPPGLTVREGRAVEAVISSGGKVVFIPDLTGEPLRQAELMLRQSNLALGSQIRSFSSTVERDHIISQDPPAGEIAEQNSYVNIVVSRGPDREEEDIEMVSLLGLNVGRVDMVLAGLGLEVSRISTVEDEDYPEGTVVEQSPEQGETVEPGHPVEIVVTRRPRITRQVRDILITYEVTEDVEESKVRIVLEDDIGKREVFEGRQPEGSRIEIPLKVLGDARYTVYYDDVEMEEVLIEEEEPEGEEREPYLFELEGGDGFPSEYPFMPSEEDER